MKRWHFILLSIGACALCYSWGYSNAPLEPTSLTVRVPACDAYPLPKRTKATDDLWHGISGVIPASALLEPRHAK